MAETKSTLHVRSNSLPSRPHPVFSEVEEHLCRLKSSDVASTSSYSIFHNLNGLQDLHDAVDKLLQLPQTQNILAQNHGMKSVNELLDGSVLLLDMCIAAKDALMQSTQLINELQSILRTKHMAELTVEAHKHLASRKATKKAVVKVLRSLKKGLRHEDNVCTLNKDDQAMCLIAMLREVEAVTIKSLESLLFFVSGSKKKSTKSKWSLVGKLMQSKRVASINPDEADRNEFETLDMELQHLSFNRASSTDDLNCHMENTKSCIVDLEEATESLFRRLIKIRVSLLNILSN